MDLNHARLPIPPYPHMLVGFSIFQRAVAGVKFCGLFGRAQFQDQAHN